MPRGRSRRIDLLVLLVAAVVLCCGRTPGGGKGLPNRLDDTTFWQMVSGFSEPNGSFPSEDVVSNESAFPSVVPLVETEGLRDRVYLGVGPEQNFTYIAAAAPRIAFIVDIRRENLLLHLMYKALIELSPTRADFVSKLFARVVPGAVERMTVDRLFDAIGGRSADPRLFATTRAAIHTTLAEAHHFRLSPEDWATLDYLYRAFTTVGPDLRYDSIGRSSESLMFPSYRELMLATDAQGTERSYLANEERYQRVRELERRNLVVPVVGDFSGPTALRSVAGWLREHDASVGVFYTSNVEQYLFKGDEWQRFYANAGALPVDAGSIFIRAVIEVRPVELPSHQPAPLRTIMMTSPIADTVAAARSGRIHHYRDVIDLSRAQGAPH